MLRKTLLTLFIFTLLGSGLLISLLPDPRLAKAQDDTAGVDVIFLLDGAMDRYRIASADERNNINTAMFLSTDAAINYLSGRAALQIHGEQHRAGVIRFGGGTAQVLTDLQPLPLSEPFAPDLQALPLCDDCSSDFDVAFEEARRQFNQFGAESDRRRIIVLLSDDPFDQGQDDRNFRGSYLDTISGIVGSIPDLELQVWGFGVSARWTQFNTDNYWNKVYNAAATHYWQYVSPINAQTTLLKYMRGSLPALGDTIMPGTVQVKPYMSSMVLFFFRTRPGITAEITHESGYTPEIVPTTSQGNYLQVITIKNPIPGQWTVTLREGDTSYTLPSTEQDALEFIQRDAQFEHSLIVNDKPTLSFFVNQSASLVWTPIGYDGTPIIYAQSHNRPAQVNATIQQRNSTRSYNLILTYQEDGTYSSPFYGVEPGQYTINSTAQVQSYSLPAANITDFSLNPVELAFVNLPAASQFTNWQFSVEFRPIGSNDAVPVDFGDRPRVSVEMVLQDGNRIPLNIDNFDPRTGIYSSENIFMLYNEPIELQFKAEISPMDGKPPIKLPTRMLEGIEKVMPVPDAGTISFAASQPRLLDTTQITYAPLTISASQLNNYLVNSSGQVFAQVKELGEGDDNEVWNIPMEFDGVQFVANFYATRPVQHQVTAVAAMMLDGNLREIITLTGGIMEPRPVTVRFDSPTEAVQFEPYTVKYTILDGETELTTPFTSNVQINTDYIVSKPNVADTLLHLTQVGNSLSQYEMLYDGFIRSGDYTVMPNFTVQQNPFSSAGEPRLVPLLVYQDKTPQVNIHQTATALHVANASGNPVDSASPLHPLTFTLDLPDIKRTMGLEAFNQKYGISNATLVLSLEDDENEPAWNIALAYNASADLYQGTFFAAKPGNYLAQAQINGSSAFGTAPLISMEDITAQTIAIQSITIAVAPLPSPQFRQTDPINLLIDLRQGDQVYEHTTMAGFVDITIIVERNRQPVQSQNTRYDSQQAVKVVPLGPFTEEGNYVIKVTGTTQDSNNRTATVIAADGSTDIAFTVSEAHNLIVETSLNASQYSTGFFPLTGRNPLIVEVTIDSIPNNAFLANNLETPERADVDPSTVFDTDPETWYKLEVFRGSNPIAKDYEVSKPEVLSNGRVRYKIYDLPDGDNYIIQVAIAENLNPAFPYRIPSTTAASSRPVTYQRHPLQYIFSGIFLVAAVGAISYGTITYRKRNRMYPPLGYLYLTDAFDRVLWVYDLKNIPTNTFIITSPQGWERALIEQMEIISGPELKAKEQIRVRLKLRGRVNQEPILINATHEPFEVGDGRFKLGRTPEPTKRHTVELELKRIAEHE